MIILKTKNEIDKITQSCKIVSEVLSELKKAIKPGVSTFYLNVIAEEIANTRNAIPGFKNYNGFPYSLCASVNNVVLHGLPSKNLLMDGDVISLDFGILLNGYYGDAAITVPVGTISERKDKLIKVTEAALLRGINKAYPGNKLADITYEIQTHVEINGFSIVRDYGGHGIGKDLHEKPYICNCWEKTSNVLLKPGMILAIEPLVNEGGPGVEILPNGWEIVTNDKCTSAHFEHTVVITNNGPVILTA